MYNICMLYLYGTVFCTCSGKWDTRVHDACNETSYHTICVFVPAETVECFPL